jgi:hypothetical protein
MFWLLSPSLSYPPAAWHVPLPAAASLSMRARWPHLAQLAEPFLFRVACLAPRLPASTDRRRYHSCLASSNARRRGLLAGHVTRFLHPMHYYWTESLVSTVISHPNTYSSMSKSFAYAQIMTKIIYDDRLLLLICLWRLIILKLQSSFTEQHGAVKVTPVREGSFRIIKWSETAAPK